MVFWVTVTAAGDSVFLGKIAGSQTLGTYTVAYEIEHGARISSADAASYTTGVRQARKQRGAYLDIFAVTVTIALPIAALRSPPTFSCRCCLAINGWILCL